MIAIIDYGMGNLRSVQKALERSGAKTRIVSSAGGIRSAGKVVLPGVGAFRDAMRELKRLGLIAPIKEAIRLGRPFLGLCLGMQLLFDESEEGGRVRGLGVLRGRVKRFHFTRDEGRGTRDVLKVPHMGWNNIVPRPSSIVHRNTILKGVPDGAYMYFVHSYYVEPKDRDMVLTATDYGIRFTSGVASGNIYGFQFHPEKSQEVGLRILSNFVRLK